MFESDIFLELLNRYHENKLSHAFLFETNNINKCYSDLLKFLKIINCPHEYSDNCNEDDCLFCNLLDKGNLPSYYLIEPDGIQIKKTQVKEMMDKFTTIPVYSKYNIYVILNCEKLNSSSANSLLKFLEEPTDNIIGFFITSNKSNVISTIKSRCQDLNIYYDEPLNYKDSLVNVISYLNGIYKNKEGLLFNKEIAMSYYEDRKDWIKFFTDMFYIIENYYKTNNDNYGILLLEEMNEENIVKIMLLIETILKYLQSNGNIELILDKFVIEMRNIYA